MAELNTPVICTVVGEGGSGGALAIGVGDRTLILQYSTYSVISPEGCASILWKSADKASVAAETLAITADRLKANGLVDRIVEEPLGGAQRDWDAMFQSMRRALTDTLGELRKQPLSALLDARYQRLRAYGSFKEIAAK
jgi:acetyl-CoA carboxylase carboxyl transferase subunit alpha